MGEDVGLSDIENSDEQNRQDSKRQLLRRISLFFVGLMVFILGFFFFLPLGQIAREALNRVSTPELSLQVGDIQLGVWGGFKFSELKLFTQTEDSLLNINIPSISGQVSLLSLLVSSNLDLKTTIPGPQFTKGAIRLKGGLWEIQAAISGIRRVVNFMKGDISIAASSFIFYYDEPLPMLDETLEIPITAMKIEGKLDQGILRVQKGILESRLANVEISGSAGLYAASPIDINIVVHPSEELYQKYQDKGLREILTSFKILQPDGRMQFHLSGTFARPMFRTITSNELQ